MGCVSSMEFMQLKNQMKNQMKNQIKYLEDIKNQIKQLGDRLIDHSQNNTENKFMRTKKSDEASTIQQTSKLKNTQDKLQNETIYQKFIKKIKSEEFVIFKEKREFSKTKNKKKNDELCQFPILSNDIQDLIRNYYQRLIDQKLQAFNEGKILPNEFKNQLSWYIVKLNLAIMQKIVKQPTFEYTGNNFKSLEQFQKQFLGFLKKKYPRGDNLDAGQLSNEFKELVDFTDQYQNDILTSAGFYFDSEDGFQIIKAIKLFINKLIDQTNQNYKTFSHFMKKQIFQTFNQDKFVIGRKIPQNVTKYKRIDKNSLQIHSNEIFRILVKWIDDLQETVKNPSQKISSNSEWCFVRKQEKKKPELIKCAKYYRQMFIQQGLYKKIQQLNQLDKKNKKDSRISKFNVSVINSFHQVQIYSPLHILRQQAQIIKFSELNMKYHKQNVEQKLIQLIQILVRAASQIKNKITYDNQIKPHKSTQIALNLVKFKISDLLRCKFEGNKEQIIQIKKKFETLQSQNKLKIIKIKNRFNTDLSDAMIIFKILKQRKTQNPICEQNPSKENEEQVNKPTEQNGILKQQKQIKRQFQEQCYLICQCQLILTQKSKSSNKKLYNIQTLNHYLYELERSPFKVLGQSILQLNYKYDIIKYASKIKVIQSALNENLCRHQNTIQVKQLQVKDQNFSMVCGRCWVFYQPFQNNSKIKACTKCFIYLCYKCNSKQKRPIQNKNEQNCQFIDSQKKQDKLLALKEFQEKIRQKYLEYFTLVFDKRKFFMKEYLSFQQNQDKKRFQQFRNTQEMFKMKNQTKASLKQNFHQPKQNLKQCFGSKDQIKVKQLILFLYKEYHQMNYEGTIERIFFMIMSFSKNRVILRGYKYETYDQRLVNVQNQQESYQGHQLFQLNEYDVLYYPKAYENNCQSRTGYQKIFLFQKSNQLNVVREKLITYCYFNFWKQTQNGCITYSIVYDVFMKTTRKSSLEEFQQFMIRKRLVYMSKQLNDDQIMQLKNKFYLKKPSISKKHFTELKLINLQNNQIKNPQKFLEDCKQLQILILKNNFIKQIKFNDSLDSLQVLQLKNNQIKQIQGLQNLKCLKILNLQNNELEEIFNVRNSEGDENQSVKNKKQFIFPFLNDLNLSKNELKLVFKIHALKLESIDLSKNELQDVSELLSSSLENLKQLDLQDNKISKIEKIAGSVLKIQTINIGCNQLQDVSDLLSSSLQNLKQLNLKYNKISKIEKIAGSALKIQKIILQGNQLQDVSELLSSSLENLKQLNLKYNKISKIEKISGSALKNIQKIILQGNQLQDVSELLSSSFENLKQIDLRNNKINKTGLITGSPLKNIQKIILSYNQLQNVSELLSSSLENLKQLDLNKNKICKIGKISGSALKNIQKIILSYNQLQDVSELLSSSLENFKQLDLRNNKINITGKITGSALKIQRIDLSYNELQDVSELLSSSSENLKQLNLSNNKISKITKIAGSALKIQTIYLSYNQLQDVSELLSSSLENLKYLDLRNNRICTLKSTKKSQFSKLRQIRLTTNKLTQIPDLNVPVLQKINLRQNDIKTFTSQQIEKFKNLKQFSISLNQFLCKILIFNHPTLQQFYLKQNKVQNILQFFKSNLPKLKIINLQKSIYLAQLPNINNFTQLQQLQLQQCPIVLNDTFKLMQQQNSQYSKLKVLKLSIKTSSQQQFNRQKYKIQKILYYKIQTLKITRFIQKTPPKQSSQQLQTEQIQIQPKTIQPQDIAIPQSNIYNQNTFEMIP